MYFYCRRSIQMSQIGPHSPCIFSSCSTKFCQEAVWMVPFLLLQRSCTAHIFAGRVFECEGWVALVKKERFDGPIFVASKELYCPCFCRYSCWLWGLGGTGQEGATWWSHLCCFKGVALPMFLQVELLTVRAGWHWSRRSDLMVPSVLFQRSCTTHVFLGGVFDCEGWRLGGTGSRQQGGEEWQMEVEGFTLWDPGADGQRHQRPSWSATGQQRWGRCFGGITMIKKTFPLSVCSCPRWMCSNIAQFTFLHRGRTIYCVDQATVLPVDFDQILGH